MGYGLGDSFPFDFGSKCSNENVQTAFLSTRWNYIWFKIERKTVTTTISHSM